MHKEKPLLIKSHLSSNKESPLFVYSRETVICVPLYSTKLYSNQDSLFESRESLIKESLPGQVMHSAFEALHAGAEKDSCLPLYNRAMVAMVQWQNDDTWVPQSQENAPP